MNEHDSGAIWQAYYRKALARRHSPKSALAHQLNDTGLKVVVDCGCGVGADAAFFDELAYQVHAYDINADALAICEARFAGSERVLLSQSSFDDFCYPNASIVLAHNALFFANPDSFNKSWSSIVSALVVGGIFVGDFMGPKDSWATNYRSPTTALSRDQVTSLFEGFEIIEFSERDEYAKTSLGRLKHWHTFSVVARKYEKV